MPSRTQGSDTYFLGQCGFLFRSAEFEKLLNDVVAEHVGHQVVRGGQYLREHQLLLGRGSPFQLLLYKPGAVLILGELDDVIGQVS